MRKIARIAVKILAIYLLVESLTEGIPQAFGIFNMRQSMTPGMVSGIIIAYLIKLTIAIYLWYSAEKIANLIIVSNKDVVIKTIDYQKLQLIAFSVVGIVLLVLSIPDIIQYLLEYYYLPGRVLTRRLPELVAKIIEIIIGILLLLKSNIIVTKNLAKGLSDE